MKAATLLLALALVAIAVVGCSTQPQTVGTEDTNVAGDASAQIEDTFDRGFDEAEVISAANEIDPTDLEY